MPEKLFPLLSATELKPGDRRILQVTGVGSVGVFNVGGCFMAIKNVCPHQGAELCRGVLTGTAKSSLRSDGLPTIEWEREGEILRCPWHQWEFDLFTGKAVSGPPWRVATYDVMTGQEVLEAEPPAATTYPVEVADGMLFLVVGR